MDQNGEESQKPMTAGEEAPAPVIDEYNDVLSRPCLRTFAFLPNGEAERTRMRDVISLLRGPLAADVTVCSGTHLSPKKKRHRIRAKDLGALDAILDPKAHWAGFNLFGDASLDAPPFALPMFRVLRGLDGFTIDLAFRPDVDIDYVVETVWPVMRGIEPDYAYLGWGMLPHIARHEHDRRVSARFKARYRAAACLDAWKMETIVLDEEAAAKQEERDGEPAEVGITDLGWKTVLGPRFLSRVNVEALKATSALVRELPTGCVEITIGDRPVWGDTEMGHDPYGTTRRDVLATLSSIMASKPMVLRWGGLDMTAPRDTQIVETYFTEWLG